MAGPAKAATPQSVPLTRAAYTLRVPYRRALDLLLSRRLEGHQDDRGRWMVDVDSLRRLCDARASASPLPAGGPMNDETTQPGGGMGTTPPVPNPAEPLAAEFDNILEARAVERAVDHLAGPETLHQGPPPRSDDPEPDQAVAAAAFATALDPDAETDTRTPLERLAGEAVPPAPPEKVPPIGRPMRRVKARRVTREER